MGLLEKIRGSRCTTCMGMELSASAVKIAILTRKGERIILKRGLTSPISKIALSMNPGKRETIGKQITAIWRSAEIEERKVRVSLPGKLTFIGRMKVPISNSDNIERYILTTIEKRASMIDSEDIVIDYFIYSKYRDELDILYIIVKKDVIEFYQDIFAHGELELVSIQSTPLALANITNVNYPKDMVDLLFIVVDIGAYESNLIAMKDNKIVSNVSLDIGGSLVTNNLSNETGLSFKDAEKMKITGKGDEKVLRESAYQLALQLKEGIERCIKDAEYFLGYEERIEAIYLTGGASHTPFLLAELSSIIGVKVEHLLPIRKIELHPNLNPTKIYDISPQLSVAMGTALSGI